MRQQLTTTHPNNSSQQIVIIDNQDTHLTDQQKKERKKLIKDEKVKHKVGFLNWYWTKYGFFTMMRDLWGKFFLDATYGQIFSNIGSAIGYFFTLRLVVARYNWQ